MSVSDSAFTDESEFEISSSDCEKKKDRPRTEYVCEFCNMKFRKNAKYIRHLRTHTKEVVAVFDNQAIETLCMPTSRLWKVI